MTLLEIRLGQRRQALDSLYQHVADLRCCDRETLGDIGTRAREVEQAAMRISRLCDQIADLSDVQRYGAGGGRSTSAKNDT